MGLMDLLPEYYLNSPQVKELQEAYDYWVEALRAAKVDLFLQLNVETATWGLKDWEEMLALKTNLSKSDEYRKAIIKAKLQGAGTTTPAKLKSVAETFTGWVVQVIEHNSEYYFEIKFIDKRGIPDIYEDMNAAIEEIKPAHLGLVWHWKWLIWDELDGLSTSWDILDAHNLTWDELQKLYPDTYYPDKVGAKYGDVNYGTVNYGYNTI